jgi:membrane protein YqaA with SNARE-associated domain
MSETELALSGLFLSSLLASTLLPGGSEALLLWIAQQGNHPLLTLLAVATAGNSVGGMITWGMGRFAHLYWGETQQSRQSTRASAWIERYGAPALLLSWLPLIGDALCLAAGWFRISALPALLFIATGKLLRYAGLLWLL